jgi:hypothetical protein
MHNLAPIVLFVYNRPEHTRRTVEALQKNDLALDSDLFVYSDNARDEKVQEDVDAVRAYIKTITGFKKVTIIEQEKNKGLANSIIDGVTEIVNMYGKVIVLEDDLVTSPYFLKFMNDALDYYENEKKVWHISGWNYPIDTDGLDDVFLWRGMNCWGWATWRDRWQYFEKDLDKIIATFDQKAIKKFNVCNGTGFWDQIIANKMKKNDTWAIFWYATIFKQGGLCLNPAKTFVDNIGIDDSGHNCRGGDIFKNSLNSSYNVRMDAVLRENDLAVRKIIKFYKRNTSFYKLFKKYLFEKKLCWKK